MLDVRILGPGSQLTGVLFMQPESAMVTAYSPLAAVAGMSSRPKTSRPRPTQ